MVKFLPAHFFFKELFYGIYDRLERLRIIHSEVGKHFTVQTDVLLGKSAHKLRIRDAVLTRGGVYSLDPESAEIALLGSAVTVCVGETFLIGVLRNRPYISSGQEIAAGSLENLLAASP